MKYIIVKINQPGKEFPYFKIQYRFLFWWINWSRPYEYSSIFASKQVAQKVVDDLRNKEFKKREIINY